MKNKRFFLGMLGVLLAFGLFSIAGCATYSTRDGVTTPLGAFTSAKINESRPVIAEYSIILGLITTGYPEFLAATKGKEIDIIDTNYFNFFQKVQAVQKE
ncbi:MAG: hypothetical protein LBD24_04090 [Spirochaetaceae bacterium]|nr:hypothetical protein [Spirochaetaceae bacterium]